MGTTLFIDRAGKRWLIAAVADGAGSAELAKEGSRIAAESFIEGAAEAIFNGLTADLAALMRTAAVFAQTMLLLIAEDASRPVSDYHTTLLGCISDGTRTAFLQVGDGGIVVREISTEGEAVWRLVFKPDNGEQRNLTYFITLPDAFEHLQVSVWDEPLTHVVLFTDGLQDILLTPSTMGVHTPLFDRLQQALAPITNGGDAETVSAGLHTLLDSQTMRTFTADDTSLLAIRLTS